ncbi:hypothetical protein KP509_01G001700 [Ceratopteris richardii]|uniref:FAF domain-containing protein n=1 Tax=Ceratopteris richardii TaxID=49495 RepID=A0A8T2VDZ0_CERRI|nr:hypothetical protein KP509_01G001700 [Ceratopteris richardii]
MTRSCHPICTHMQSPTLFSARSQICVPDGFQDYWQDASVCMQSRNNWGTLMSTSFSDASNEDIAAEHTKNPTKPFPDSPPFSRKSYRYPFNNIVAKSSFSRKGPRSFPPPMAAFSTVSIKEGGRFVLKKMNTYRPRNFFRSQRVDGRLVLYLVTPNDFDDHGMPSFPEEIVEDAERVDSDDIGDGSNEECQQIFTDADEVTDEMDFVRNLVSKEEKINAFYNHLGMSTEGTFSDSTVPHVELDPLESVKFRESKLDNDPNSAAALPVQSAFWSADMAAHAMANLSSLSSKKMCLHPSIFTTSFSLGLAM